MRKRSRSDYLLIEILIAVFFLMVSLTILAQVFGRTRKMALRSAAETEALAAAQNTLELAAASEDVEQSLTEQGFTLYHGVWTKNEADWTLLVSGGYEESATGRLWSGDLTAYMDETDLNQARQKDAALFTLPCVWYRGE